ncbi:hypothetical protein IE81DRAFT_329218 [Ceraceosorus guamensis]|uniref:Uncharacterized protein n=1 Tax=Ceraceosorus guamensis TaxID=1522189 RepID=A0A316W2V6_9BASI|nr:hypothetical protein IE81DRAFT_329218 [Ceraceosorus guamensis]PWN43834.1 hypothetical protein IE81DRAFT_329218 [Ceraceosorus guamensis]
MCKIDCSAQRDIAVIRGTGLRNLSQKKDMSAKIGSFQSLSFYSWASSATKKMLGDKTQCAIVAQSSNKDGIVVVIWFQCCLKIAKCHQIRMASINLKYLQLICVVDSKAAAKGPIRRPKSGEGFATKLSEQILVRVGSYPALTSGIIAYMVAAKGSPVPASIYARSLELPAACNWQAFSHIPQILVAHSPSKLRQLSACYLAYTVRSSEGVPILSFDLSDKCFIINHNHEDGVKPTCPKTCRAVAKAFMLNVRRPYLGLHHFTSKRNVLRSRQAPCQLLEHLNLVGS